MSGNLTKFLKELNAIWPTTAEENGHKPRHSVSVADDGNLVITLHGRQRWHDIAVTEAELDDVRSLVNQTIEFVNVQIERGEF